MQNGFELPKPPAEALAHSLRVAERIRQRIRTAGGWVDFADYMDMVLFTSPDSATTVRAR